MIRGPHILYRCFNADGELLYIGITNDPDQRFAVHAKQTPWWPDVADIKLDHNFDSRYRLVQAERVAILNEIPLHNSVHNNRWHTKHKPAPPTQAMRDALSKLGELLLPDEWRSEKPEHATTPEK